MNLRPRLPRIRFDQAIVALLLLLTVIALAVSAQGLYKVALDQEIAWPWLWPALVDLVGVAVSLAVWRAGRLNVSALWPRVVLYAVTVWSVACQVVSAPDRWQARTVHAWAPLAVLVVFEVLLWIVNVIAADERVSAPVSAAPEAVGYDWKPPALRVAGHPEQIQTEHACAELLRRGRDVTGENLAEILDVSPATGRRRKNRWLSGEVQDRIAADLHVELREREGT